MPKIDRVGVIALILASVAALASSSLAGERHEAFDRDPGWEGYRNRLTPASPRITKQRFGYRSSGRAGGRSPGEVGGRVQRSATPASYAKAIAPKSLQDRLEASGIFSVPYAGGGSGALIGWFRHDARTWRTPNSLTFRIDGNGGKFWVFFEYGTRNGMTGGAGAFEGERYQTTKTKPFPADGAPHRWRLLYDPQANEGRGAITFTINDRRYRLPLPAGHKADGASFDRFGLLNVMVAGDGLDVFLDDLVVDGVAERFDRDPDWDGRGNEVTFEDRVQRPYHDFGFSPTARSGGAAGELGGIIWRDEAPAYYADRVGPLTLDQPLFASGRIAFTAATADSGVYLGWFDSAAKRSKTVPEHEKPQRNLLGLLLEGPSRVGHYLRPVYRVSDGSGEMLREGPILKPDGRVHSWSIRYDPKGADGRGRITTTVDGQRQSIDLQPGLRERNATFDRFGLFNIQSGGHYVELYLDDLRYSVGDAQRHGAAKR